MAGVGRGSAPLPLTATFPRKRGRGLPELGTPDRKRSPHAGLAPFKASFEPGRHPRRHPARPPARRQPAHAWPSSWWAV